MSDEEKEEKKELDWLTKTVIEAIGKYYTETVEVTKTVRVPKGKYCDNCAFLKYEQAVGCCVDSNCCYGGYAWCAIHGKRLNSYEQSYLPIPPTFTNRYNKCKECLEDTKENKGD